MQRISLDAAELALGGKLTRAWVHVFHRLEMDGYGDVVERWLRFQRSCARVYGPQWAVFVNSDGAAYCSTKGCHELTVGDSPCDVCLVRDHELVLSKSNF